MDPFADIEDPFADIPDVGVPPHMARSRSAQERSHAQGEADELLRETTLGEDATALLTGAADYASGGAMPALVAAVQGTKDHRPKWLQGLGIDFPTDDSRPFAERKADAEATRDEINTRAPGAYATGQGFGAIGPGGVVGRAVGSGASAARHATPASLIRRAVGGAAEGAKAGAPLGAIAGAGQTDTGEIDDVLANAALGGVGGAAVGGAVGTAGAPAIAKTRIGKGGLRELARNAGIDASDVSRAANALADVPYVGAPLKGLRALATAAGFTRPTPRVRTKATKDSDVRGYEATPEEPAPWGDVEWAPAASSSSANARTGTPAPTTAGKASAAKPVHRPASDMPGDVMAGGVPKDVRAAAVEKLSAEDFAPPRAPVTPKGVSDKVPAFPFAEPGERGYGVMVTLDEFQALQAAGRAQRPIAPPSASAEEAARAMPLATPSQPAPLTDAALKAAVEEGVRQGVPLAALAKQLSRRFGVPVTQGTIGALFKGAQNSLPVGPQGFR